MRKQRELFSFRRNQVFFNMISYLAFILTAYPSCSVLHLPWTSVGPHDCLPGSPPDPISQILPATQSSLTRLHSLLSMTTATELGNFRSPKNDYIHNSVLPHSSQYIGDYTTTRWILTIEINNINFCLQHKWNRYTNFSSEVVFSVWCSPEGSYHSTYVKHGICNIRHEYRRQDQKCPVLMSSLCHMYVTERATFKAFQIVNHICLFRVTVLIRTEGKKE